MSDICIKAGKDVYEMIQDGGFNLDRVATYFAPAGGPRWLVAGGFDLALLKSGLLGENRPVLLVGSSAGAWRLAAWLQPEAETSYRRLIEAYIAMPYGRKETPASVLDSLVNIINAYLEEDAIPFALSNKRYRLAVITVRARNLLASDVKWIQRLGLGICFFVNFLDRSYLYNFIERVVFYTGGKPPDFCFRKGFRGNYAALGEANFRHAVLASAAIPLVVSGVRDPYGAPEGVYRDGGLIDYHLTRRYGNKEGDVTLFFHHQERIIPGWLDKGMKSRKPSGEVLGNVLMVHPSPEFIAKLPGGRIPDRTDFITFMDNREKRMENWKRVVELSAPLGEEFLDIVASGRIKGVTKRLS